MNNVNLPKIIKYNFIRTKLIFDILTADNLTMIFVLSQYKTNNKNKKN